MSIKVYFNQAKYFRSLPLHWSQQEIKSTDEYSVFEYHIRPTYEFEQEILSHGADVEVLEPAWFRDKLINRVKELAWRYKL